MRFSKWHALGNAYLLIEPADACTRLGGALVRHLCDVHHGIGADGVLEITRINGPRAQLLIWNPDGSQAELSGNGTRIAARWLARRSGSDTVEVGVGERVVRSWIRDGALVEQDLGPVAVGSPESLDVEGATFTFTPVSMGNPHAVIERPPDRDTLLELGPVVEHHARFPERTNVQLVRVDGRHEITVRIWERGVGETRASGTSACAAAAAMIAGNHCSSPVVVTMPGGEVEVAIEDGRARLIGPAEEICTGEVAVELLAKAP
jgi:diaminopimelate epimerase